MVHPVYQHMPPTIFDEMSGLAREHGAINLGQGFPDAPGPPAILRAAADAVLTGKQMQRARYRIKGFDDKHAGCVTYFFIDGDARHPRLWPVDQRSARASVHVAWRPMPAPGYVVEPVDAAWRGCRTSAIARRAPKLDWRRALRLFASSAIESALRKLAIFEDGVSS